MATEEDALGLSPLRYAEVFRQAGRHLAYVAAAMTASDVLAQRQNRASGDFFGWMRLITNVSTAAMIDFEKMRDGLNQIVHGEAWEVADVVGIASVQRLLHARLVEDRDPAVPANIHNVIFATNPAVGLERFDSAVKALREYEIGKGFRVERAGVIEAVRTTAEAFCRAAITVEIYQQILDRSGDSPRRIDPLDLIDTRQIPELAELQQKAERRRPFRISEVLENPQALSEALVELWGWERYHEVTAGLGDDYDLKQPEVAAAIKDTADAQVAESSSALNAAIAQIAD